MPNLMNLEQINDAIRTAGARVSELSGKLALAATQSAPDLTEVARLQDELQRESARLDALKTSAKGLGGADESTLKPQGLSPAQERTKKEIRSSNEYARAFAYALRQGVTPNNGYAHAEQVKPLYDALTIGGGSPTGADGGFLVPEDIDHTIKEQMRTLNPLRQFFGVEPVNTNSGWRVTDTAPTTGFSQVNETATVPSNDQPVFGKVSFTLVKYALILPISNELLNDEVANLFGYLARWGGKKETITENTLLLAALSSLSSAAVDIEAGKELRGLKHILNVALDPAVSLNAVVITNQDGFDLLDGLEDLQGRPLMVWDPTASAYRTLGGRQVKMVSNATLPSVATGEGNDAVTKAPFYLGDGQEYATLFERAAMEMLSTNIGGTAFTNDTTNIRFIKRMAVSKFDQDAMKMAKLVV